MTNETFWRDKYVFLLPDVLRCLLLSVRSLKRIHWYNVRLGFIIVHFNKIPVYYPKHFAPIWAQYHFVGVYVEMFTKHAWIHHIFVFIEDNFAVTFPCFPPDDTFLDFEIVIPEFSYPFLFQFSAPIKSFILPI